MVTIVNAHLRNNEKGDYVSLELKGDITMIQSINTGRMYATKRKCFIYCTFDLETATELIGTKIPGRIERVECPPYNYTVEETGEVVQLAHTYTYVPEGGVAMPVVNNTLAEA